MAPAETHHGTKLANAILYPVAGIVLLAILLAVVVVAWTSHSVDHSAQENERGLIRNSLDLQMSILAKEQEGAAVSNAAFAATQGPEVNPTWLHINIGERLFKGYGHDDTLIIGPDRKLLYRAAGGEMAGQLTDPRLMHELWPLIARVRARSIINLERLPSGHFLYHRPAEAFIQSIHETGFASIDGEPAMVSVSAISPEQRQVLSLRQPPSVIVSLRRLDADWLAEIAEMAKVEGLSILPARHDGPTGAAIVLKSPHSAPLAHLTWNPRYPGSDILRRVAPFLAFLGLAIAALTALVLLYTRQNTRRLAYSEARALHAAMHDGLTGLANRNLFGKRFEELLDEWRTSQRPLGVAYIDLDHFKDINDTLGHAAGDDVIRETARRLRFLMPEDGVLARISGDEFALLVPGIASRSDFEKLLRRIQDRFAAPMYVAGNHLFISASVGAALAPEHGGSMGELLRKADIALYAAKSGGRGRWAFFESSMEEQVQARENLARELRQAIDRDELSLVYQPQTTIEGDRVVGVEALVRWCHPQRGPITPASFIPLAEEIGLINELGLWVLRRACRDAAMWPHLDLAVNVSPIQFRHPQFIERLSEILAACNFDPHRLEIEVTENVFASKDAVILDTLQKVQRLGVRVALDDFGSGYSSLSYLRQFPFDTLKIDRGFIAGLDSSHHAAAILATIINLGEALGMTIVAEGIETERQAAFLRLTNCDRLQGYYLSRPIACDEILAFEQSLVRTSGRKKMVRYSA